ncbi:MAG: helix-turn-helix domain-containing protein [Bacteroidota bacterium]
MNRSTEHFTTALPQDPALQGIIAYYYVHRTFSDAFARSFYYYPHHGRALNVFEHSDVVWDGASRYTLPSRVAKRTIILTSPRRARRQVHMVGRVNKLGIVFEPLGLNRFVDVPLGHAAPDTIVAFPHLGRAFGHVLDRVAATPDLKEKVALLDRFFVAHDRGPTYPAVLDDIMGAIGHADGQLSIHAAAAMYGVHQRTLLRLFRQHVGCSPQQFASVVRFRAIVDRYTQAADPLSLTELAYASGFCDQSAFIKHMRAMVGVAPGRFFQSMRDQRNRHTVWTAAE